MELEFRICNQSLKRTDENKPADLSNEYLTCKFNFLSDDWDAMGKFAIFRCGDKTYREAIIEDECIVPFDALKSDKFILTLYGVNEDVRITTNYIWVTLKRSAFVDKYDESSYFNPDMTEELFDAVEQKLYTSRFIETIGNINDEISGLTENKVDKTDYNVDLENINNAITGLTENKVDESTFVDAVGNINSDISNINGDISSLSDNKVDKVAGKQLSTNDFNNNYKSELDNLPSNLNSKVDVSEYSETTTDIYNQLDILEHIEVIKVVTDKGTASEETMNKLFIEVKPDLVDVYYTKYEDNSYHWVKMDDDILDNLHIGWDDVQSKPATFPPSEHTHSFDDLNDKPFIPSKTSDLDNDVPFLTEHQDISGKADKIYVDTELNKKANKTYVDTELNKKANSTEVYNKSEVDALIYNLQNSIKINGTEDVIQANETVEIYAYSVNDGMPVINKKIHFYEIMED